MKLNDAHIENMLDAAGNELTLVRKFGEVVKHAELVADVYMNDHKVFTAPVCVTENTGYLMASIDGRFALDPVITLERVLVRVRHVGRDEVLFSSNTVGVNQPIDAYDYDADIYFRLMNVWEGSATRTRAPETKFRCLYKNTFGTINLDEQPSAYDDVEPDSSGSGDGSSSEGSSGSGSESGSEGGSDGGSEVAFTVESLLVTASNFNDQRYLSPLKDYYENYPDFGEIESTWDNPEWVDHSHWPWLCIAKDFDKPYRVVVKFKATGSDEFEVKYNSDTDFPDGVPITAGTQNPDVQVPRKYFLISLPDDMHMNGYNAAGDSYTPEDGEFEVWFTPAE